MSYNRVVSSFWMRLCLLTLCAGALPARPVQAEPAPLATDQARSRDEAIEIFNQGKAAFKAGDYDAAQQLFLKAWGKYDREPLIALALAKAFDRAANMEKAQIYYEAFLRLAPAEKDFAKDREQTVQRLAEVKAVLASRPGVLKFQGLPPGARLMIDERPADPDTNGEIKVAAGTHAIRVTLEPFLPFEREAVTVTPGDAKVINVVLLPPVDPATLPHDYKVAWGLGAAAGAAVITGGIFAILMSSTQSDMNATLKDPPTDTRFSQTWLDAQGFTVPDKNGKPVKCTFVADCPAATAAYNTLKDKYTVRQDVMIASFAVAVALGVGTAIAVVKAPLLEPRHARVPPPLWARVLVLPTADGHGATGVALALPF